MSETANRSSLQAVAAKLRDEWQDNFRLRMACWFVALLLGVYLVLVLRDNAELQVADLLRQRELLERIEAIEVQKDWPAREQESVAALTDVTTRLWRAGNEGLARATVQTWVDRELKSKGVEKLRARVDVPRPVNGEADIWSVGVEVEGEFVATQLEDLLFSMARNPQTIVVERLDITSQERQSRFSMLLRFYVLREAAKS